LTQSEKSIVSAKNRENGNGEVGQVSLVDSFNKHYTDYLERYSTNRRIQPESAEGTGEVESEATDPVIVETEDGDLFFTPEAVGTVVEPENNDVSENISSSTSEPEVEEETKELVSEADLSPAPEGVEDDYSISLGEDEDVTPPAEEKSILGDDDDDDDYFFTPDDGNSIEEEEDELLALYEHDRENGLLPEQQQQQQQPVEQPQTQHTIEREVVREVLVVDREQAIELGYGADRYTNDNRSTAPLPAPAHNAAPETAFSPSQIAPKNQTQLPSFGGGQAAPTPTPVVVERTTERRPDVYEEEAPYRPRPAEKSNGFFGGLFKRNKDSDVSDVSAYVADVSEYKERSRVREESLETDFLGAGDESNILSLKTQDNYDPREERRRMQHVATEQRDVDPAGWLEKTMIDALKMDASDLHIVVDGETKDLHARIRVDGQMQDFDFVTGIPAKVIMGRLKAATKLSSGGSYAPEETIYELQLDGEKRKARAVLFRVEDGGEALVMRLPLTGNLRKLDELAFSEKNLSHVLDLLAMPYKLIMIAGPMGSGKTTTAHGALLHVADPTRTVWTIEDPVERRLPNLVQLEIDEENGAGFDVLLSKLLRADYNTLFLGEIRDNATAAAAVRQAKAGRQVMSTIHADDNIKSLMRLVELAGDSPMSVLSAVGGVISQRLVRKLNPEWKTGDDPTKKYKGRIPIHEILFINDSIVEVMMQDRPLSEIKQQVRAAKGSTFLEDAVRLIEAGITDREEVVKVIGEFDADDRY
jgi:type II secretory ATPase GspE/PulE/Tfp pilus assembly ATPase PilB-like protein